MESKELLFPVESPWSMSGSWHSGGTSRPSSCAGLVQWAGCIRQVSIAHTREARRVDTIDLGYGQRGESDTGGMEGSGGERERRSTLVIRSISLVMLL